MRASVITLALLVLGCQPPPAQDQAKQPAKLAVRPAWRVSRDSDSFTGKLSSSITIMSADTSAAIRLGCDAGQPYLALISMHGIFDYETDEGEKVITLQERRDDGAPVSHRWSVSDRHADLAWWTLGNDGPAIRELAQLHKYVVQLDLYSNGYRTASFLELPPMDTVTQWLATCTPQHR